MLPALECFKWPSRRHPSLHMVRIVETLWLGYRKLLLFNHLPSYITGPDWARRQFLKLILLQQWSKCLVVSSVLKKSFTNGETRVLWAIFSGSIVLEFCFFVDFSDPHDRFSASFQMFYVYLIKVVLRWHQLITSGSPWRTRKRLSHSGRERQSVLDSCHWFWHSVCGDRAEPYSTDTGKTQDYMRHDLNSIEVQWPGVVRDTIAVNMLVWGIGSSLTCCCMWHRTSWKISCQWKWKWNPENIDSLGRWRFHMSAVESV